ncbi:hypothetical protein PR202_gb09856 [Eleusine coracana subsp. coracana]|uniref:HMA domain-containing protein n=1 Tax=Eleusine coracana subsp. coracana TaxID=191504 RepID=A0AAV5EI88_ELECO|nr:hypothetical protein QOZ80_2BG0201500 [Eleusine coracana subsp. coracana]GJN22301.1 hypothetical protein PR202_gb09856 [Eleusine coracana subsp. coracana]
MRQLCGFLGGSNGGHKDKKKVVHRRQVQTVELKVRMDCQRCEREVKKALTGLRGVQHVEVNRLLQKVTVTGEVDPPAVLRRAQSTGKKAEPWPQNPVVYAPAAAVALYGLGAAQLQAHDGRWAPASSYPNPTRNVEATGIGAEQITNMFSDDNPNACSVM